MTSSRPIPKGRRRKERKKKLRPLYAVSFLCSTLSLTRSLRSNAFERYGPLGGSEFSWARQRPPGTIPSRGALHYEGQVRTDLTPFSNQTAYHLDPDAQLSWPFSRWALGEKKQKNSIYYSYPSKSTLSICPVPVISRAHSCCRLSDANFQISVLRGD